MCMFIYVEILYYTHVFHFEWGISIALIFYQTKAQGFTRVNMAFEYHHQFHFELNCRVTICRFYIFRNKLLKMRYCTLLLCGLAAYWGPRFKFFGATKHVDVKVLDQSLWVCSFSNNPDQKNRNLLIKTSLREKITWTFQWFLEETTKGNTFWWIFVHTHFHDGYARVLRWFVLFLCCTASLWTGLPLQEIDGRKVGSFSCRKVGRPNGAANCTWSAEKVLFGGFYHQIKLVGLKPSL